MEGKRTQGGSAGWKKEWIAMVGAGERGGRER